METATSLGHLPGEKWAFDDKVTGCFEDMLLRSIPEYAAMRHLSTALARRLRQENTAVVDLGCSRGDAIAELVCDFPDGEFVGVEVSKPMLEVARSRFAARPNVRILDLDLRTDYPAIPASVTLSILAVMFVPIEYRLNILANIYKNTVEGGALIFVEKSLANTAQLNRHFVDIYYEFKRDNGYTQEEIDRKRLSLEGVLVPMPARMNEEFLQMAGFRQVDCFWRWMNFAGWVAIK